MEWINLNKLCKIIGGKPNPKDDIAFDVEGIPFVRMRDLGKYHRSTNLTNIETYINEEYAKKHGYQLIKKGAILIPRSGSVSLNHRAILGIDAGIVSHICALEVISEKIDNFYLYYYLTMLDMGRIAQKTTGLDSISFKRLGMIKIPVRPRIEQSKIVAQLNKIQELIDKRKDVVDLLDEYIKSVFLEMFGDPIINNQKRKTVLLSTIVANNISYGIVSSGDDIENGVPFIRPIDLSDRYIYNLSKLKKISEEVSNKSKKTELKGSELLLSVRGNIGTVSLATESIVGANISRGIVPLAFHSNEERIFYYHFFSDTNFHLFFNRLAKGIALKQVNICDLKKVKVFDMRNEKTILKLFSEKSQVIFQLREQYLNSLQLLDILFRIAMQKAFTKEEKIEERAVFEELIKKFSLADLKKQNRPEILIDWINKNKQQFSNFDNYDMAWEKLIELLEGGTIEQVLEGNEIKLKVKK